MKNMYLWLVVVGAVLGLVCIALPRSGAKQSYTAPFTIRVVQDGVGYVGEWPADFVPEVGDYIHDTSEGPNSHHRWKVLERYDSNSHWHTMVIVGPRESIRID